MRNACARLFMNQYRFVLTSLQRHSPTPIKRLLSVRQMKRIAYHPHIHPAQPWCVFETELHDAERLPKIGLYATRDEAQLAHPDASVDLDFAWECQLRVAP